MTHKLFFSEQEQQQIIEAIKAAEKMTSGEIKLHLDEYCKTDPYFKAEMLFGQLGLVHTAQRNAVLIYLATEDKKFAIIGDEGIHQKVGQEFWNHTIALMQKHFKENNFTTGICEGIFSIGEQLKKLFPYQKEDINEINNEISFGGKND